MERHDNMRYWAEQCLSLHGKRSAVRIGYTVVHRKGESREVSGGTYPFPSPYQPSALSCDVTSHAPPPFPRMQVTAPHDRIWRPLDSFLCWAWSHVFMVCDNPQFYSVRTLAREIKLRINTRPQVRWNTLNPVGEGRQLYPGGW